jgi:RsiW-degrading membrane proteinase PrsW (M82 family)
MLEVSLILLGFLPVTLFLGSLVYLDSYKLVRFRSILQLIASGCAAAMGSYLLNQWLVNVDMVDHRQLTRFVAPLIEELLKGLPILFLLKARRIGFLVDAAIFGFAIGTGFALVENLYYLVALPDAPITLWIVRGFGTAVMHGGTTAVAAMTTKVLQQRRESEALFLAIPGLLAAYLIHAGFNQFVLSPMLSAVLVIVIFPPLLVLIFGQSERSLQSWLGSGFDLDAELLQAIHSGSFGLSRAGQYLQSLRDHFDGTVLADMLCYLRLQTELSLRAKGILMLRESGFPVKKDAETEGKLAELRYLKKNIGKTGELALSPVLHPSSHDLWQLHMLEGGD